MVALSKSLQLQVSKLLLICLLLLLVLVGAVPGYLAGKFRWSQPPRIVHLAELKTIRQAGITIPGWQTHQQRQIPIGEHRWFKQIVRQAQDEAIVLLFPQNGPKDQPEVEWVDLNGSLRWKTDSQRQVNFQVANPAAQVTAQFFRSWISNKDYGQTYAVLQWYAWTGSGHHSPIKWFIADRRAQWQNQRMPWVAVSILLPIEPLDDIEKYWSKVESLGQAVQATLMNGPLRPDL